MGHGVRHGRRTLGASDSGGLAELATAVLGRRRPCARIAVGRGDVAQLNAAVAAGHSRLRRYRSPVRTLVCGETVGATCPARIVRGDGVGLRGGRGSGRGSVCLCRGDIGGEVGSRARVAFALCRPGGGVGARNGSRRLENGFDEIHRRLVASARRHRRRDAHEDLQTRNGSSLKHRGEVSPIVAHY